MTLQLNPPIPVSVTSDRLPEGVRATSRRGWCYAWDRCGIDGHRLWIVVMDETGEVLDVPQPEVMVDPNWSYGRRPVKRGVFMCTHCDPETANPRTCQDDDCPAKVFRRPELLP